MATCQLSACKSWHNLHIFWPSRLAATAQNLMLSAVSCFRSILKSTLRICNPFPSNLTGRKKLIFMASFFSTVQARQLGWGGTTYDKQNMHHCHLFIVIHIQYNKIIYWLARSRECRYETLASTVQTEVCWQVYRTWYSPHARSVSVQCQTVAFDYMLASWPASELVTDKRVELWNPADLGCSTFLAWTIAKHNF